MKKQIKILTTIIIFISILINLNNVVLADYANEHGTAYRGPTSVPSNQGSNQGSSQSSDPVSSAIDKVGTPSGNVNTNEITKIGGRIVRVMQIIGVVVSVVILVTLGLKYIVGSLEERAEYKKTMIPYIVGALLIGAATTIVRIIYNLITQITA